MPNAKIYYNGAWHELPGQKIYQNGAWITVPASGKIRFNGKWIDLHSHAWTYTEDTDTCSECGAMRTHVHAWQNIGRCKTCNKICPHNWSYAESRDTCTICGHTESHVHAWSEGICTTCHKICPHDWNSATGICKICNKECSHNNWTAETCSVCGKTTDKLIPFHSENCAYYISHGQLKAFDGSAVNGGSGWTAIEGTSDGTSIGIRDGKLCKIVNGTVMTLDDNTGWTQVEPGGIASYLAIRNGVLYTIDSNGELSNRMYSAVSGWTQLHSPYGIASGALYYIGAGSPQSVGSNNDWTRVSPFAGLRGGRLLLLNATSTTEPAQLSQYLDWEDVCSFTKNNKYYVSGMRDGKAYITSFDTGSSIIVNYPMDTDGACLGTAKAITYHNGTALILRDDGIYKPGTFEPVLAKAGSYTAICGVNSDYVLALNSNGDLEKLEIR